MIRELVRRVRRWGNRRRRLQDFWEKGYRELPPLAVIQNRWDSEAQNEATFDYRLRHHQEVLSRLARNGGRRLLEAACGNGLLTVVALSLGFQVTAFDFSQEAVDRFRARLGARPNVTVMKSSLETFRAHQRFDLVRCAEGFPCIIDDRTHEKAFKNLARHVRDGGHLIVEEILVPQQQMEATPGQYDVNRLRCRECYERLARETGLRLIDDLHPEDPRVHADFHWLVFERTHEPRLSVRLRSYLHHR